MEEKALKILAINGSHRNEKGFTDIVLKKFLKGAESVNAECEILYPSVQKIIPCESCGKCLFETPGICKFNDDMESIISKMDNADQMVFASPVYFDSISSNMQKMIERLRPTYDAHFEFRNGKTYHLKRFKKDQKIAVISTAGNPERGTFTSLDKILNRIIDNMGGTVVGEFYFPASHLIVTCPELLSTQFNALESAGKEFALNGKIGTELLEEGNKDYVGDPKIAVEQITQSILKMREEYTMKQKR